MAPDLAPNTLNPVFGAIANRAQICPVRKLANIADLRAARAIDS